MTSGAARVAEAVDGEAVTELVREATRIPSVTPNEEAFARWAWRQMAESDAFDSAELFECEPENLFMNREHTRGGRLGAWLGVLDKKNGSSLPRRRLLSVWPPVRRCKGSSPSWSGAGASRH